MEEMSLIDKQLQRVLKISLQPSLRDDEVETIMSALKDGGVVWSGDPSLANMRSKAEETLAVLIPTLSENANKKLADFIALRMLPVVTSSILQASLRGADDASHTADVSKFAQLLDWYLWGIGMGDVLREPLTATMIAALSPEEIAVAIAAVESFETEDRKLTALEFQRLKEENERLRQVVARYEEKNC